MERKVMSAVELFDLLIKHKLFRWFWRFYGGSPDFESFRAQLRIHMILRTLEANREKLAASAMQNNPFLNRIKEEAEK